MAVCPVNGKIYKQVELKTIVHHVIKSWKRRFVDQGYYFCTDPDCEVVYFGEDQSVIRRDEVRGKIGQKSKDINRTVCYCFDVSMKDINNEPEACRDFVLTQTKSLTCDCKIQNPSGKCCLADFPKKNHR